jgi:hypothetical protein
MFLGCREFERRVGHVLSQHLHYMPVEEGGEIQVNGLEVLVHFRFSRSLWFMQPRCSVV